MDPAAVVGAVNHAQAERAVYAEVDSRPTSKTVTDAEVYAMIDPLGDVSTVLAGYEAGKPGCTQTLRHLLKDVTEVIRYHYKITT